MVVAHDSAFRSANPYAHTTELTHGSGPGLPVYRLDRFAPAKRQDEDGFGEPSGGSLTGGVFWPHAGYVNDPALSAQNLMDAARQHGAEVRTGAEVAAVLQDGGRVTGVRLASGEEFRIMRTRFVYEPASDDAGDSTGNDVWAVKVTDGTTTYDTDPELKVKKIKD